MIQFIVTTNDTLYEQWTLQNDYLGQAVQVSGALEGFKRAQEQADDCTAVVIDLSIYAADTLIEALHAHPRTAGLQIYGIWDGKRPPRTGLPLSLRRLCTDMIEVF